MPQPRVNTTVVCLVGPGAERLVEDVGSDSNCRPVRPDDDADPLDRAVAAWREATGANLPWLLHDADPLAAVADAYRLFFDHGQHGAIEVAVEETLTRWRAGSLALPDYYLVVQSQQLAQTLRHLYLGALHDQRPARVLPVSGDAGPVRQELRALRATRWWPELDQLLAQLTRAAPDQLHRPPVDSAETA